jgi:hypothetical protein
VTQPTDLPAAGWYPDPSGAPGLRWWNGLTWSDAVHPQQPETRLAASAPPTVPTATSAWSAIAPPGGADTEQSPPATTTSRPRVLALVAGMCVLALGAVALANFFVSTGRNELDTEALELRIAASLSQSAGRDVTVSCPGSVPLESGATFTCTATVGDGREFVVLVQQTDDQGDVTWVPQQ